MWQAMSPPNTIPISQTAMPPSSGGGTHTTTIPNGDGSSTIYVHHIGGSGPPQAPQSAPLPPQQQPQMQMPQVMPIPYPMPMPAPTPAPYPYPYPPAPASYGSPFQHQQPTVVVLKQEEKELKTI